MPSIYFSKRGKIEVGLGTVGDGFFHSCQKILYCEVLLGTLGDALSWYCKCVFGLRAEKTIPWQRHHICLNVVVRKTKSSCRHAEEVAHVFSMVAPLKMRATPVSAT